MSKSQKVLAEAVYTVSTDDKGKHFMVSAAFKSLAVKAANDYDKLMVDIKPVAMNLHNAYNKVVTKDSIVNRLEFYRAFDQSIPSEYGKVGSPARTKLNAHVVFNRLVYLTERLGKQLVNGGPVKRDAKVAAKALANKQRTFGLFCKKYKLTAPAVKYLVLEILGFKGKKTNEPTKRGKDFMRAAGMSVASEE
jgi:hypothetical protein